MSKDQNSSSPNNNLERFRSSCPLKLRNFPTGVCHLGLQRARWMAENTGYLAYQEKQAPGCRFGVLTEDKHSYCFFKLLADLEGPLSDEQIMKALALTKEQIERIASTAFYKLREDPTIKDLTALHAQGGLFTEELDESDDIYFADSFSADGVQSDGIVEE